VRWWVGAALIHAVSWVEVRGRCRPALAEPRSFARACRHASSVAAPVPEREPRSPTGARFVTA
jgi:hypothetical protein